MKGAGIKKLPTKAAPVKAAKKAGYAGSVKKAPPFGAPFGADAKAMPMSGAPSKTAAFKNGGKVTKGKC